MKILNILLVVMIGFCCPVPSFAQAPSEGLGVKIAESYKNNDALVRQYTWNCRTELIEKNYLQDILIEELSYGPDGEVSRTLQNNIGGPMPFGPFQRAIAETEKKKAEKYMVGLLRVLDQYTLPTAPKILDFVSKAKTPPVDANGLLQLSGSSVVVPGDSVSLWVDSATLRTVKMEFNTFFEGDIVAVSSLSKTVPNGPTYMAYTVATIIVKELNLQVHNFDFNKNAPPSSPPIQERQLSPSIIELEIKDPAYTSGPTTTRGTTSPQASEQKLRELKSLLDQGLITQSDYDSKKAQILKGI